MNVNIIGKLLFLFHGYRYEMVLDGEWWPIHRGYLASKPKKPKEYVKSGLIRKIRCAND